MFGIETKLGTIRLSHNIVSRIASEAVSACGGKAELLNYKGKYKNVVPGIASKMNIYDADPSSVEVVDTDGSVEIRIYIGLRFGSSIKAATSTIIDYMYEKVEAIMGQKPDKVTVIVTAMLSKNIAKRYIEVSR